MSQCSLGSLRKPCWLAPHDSVLMPCTYPFAYMHQKLHSEALLPPSKAM